MPDITISLTASQVARLNEAWGEDGVPLQTSVLRALAKATKARIRRQQEDAAVLEYTAATVAANTALDAEFDNW